ncbi:MAG TPA: hypothetical protein VFQ80_05465 [Thermomicrobiales bacterium]|nr:hypothetical protein [Thermomicrobiales bacterium]
MAPPAAIRDNAGGADLAARVEIEERQRNDNDTQFTAFAGAAA